MTSSQIQSDSNCPVQKSPLIIDSLIASGKFAVFLAYSPTLRTEYAVKAFPARDFAAIRLLNTEKKLLSRLQHSNIIQYVLRVKDLDSEQSMQCVNS